MAHGYALSFQLENSAKKNLFECLWSVEIAIGIPSLKWSCKHLLHVNICVHLPVITDWVIHI